jgi:pimeloyl-ACP methyl ester carboxylesterase
MSIGLNRTLFFLLVASIAAVSSPGETISVNGRKIFFDCTGSAPGPTVILEAGKGGTTEVWKLVQPGVAHFAKICSYDRAGLGSSDPSPQPQTADQIVEDLHTLIEKAEIQPPYILVGHSIGGIYIRRFDERYPAHVAGMVFVDSAHEEQIWRFAKVDPAANDEIPNWKNISAVEKMGYLPPGAHLRWHFDNPLIVIEHTPGTWPKEYQPVEPIWHEQQEDLASRSPHGRLIIADHSGHYIQRQQPGLVVEAIKDVLKEAQQSPAGSQSPAQPDATRSTAVADTVAHCSFHRTDDHFAGGCGKLFDQEPEMRLGPAAAITTGIWRDDIHPMSFWAGDMTDEGDRAPLELEVYAGDEGVLRTEYGWFPISKFASSSSTLSFDLDTSHEVRPNSLDEKIVRTAAAILSSESAWNRNDNRKCPASATTWSIYCALEKATIDVTGGFHHRRPAMEVVREIIEERTTTRNYHHRLMGYNNDPTTHLSDVQSLFKEALRRIENLKGRVPG